MEKKGGTELWESDDGMEDVIGGVEEEQTDHTGGEMEPMEKLVGVGKDINRKVNKEIEELREELKYEMEEIRREIREEKNKSENKIEEIKQMVKGEMKEMQDMLKRELKLLMRRWISGKKSGEKES